MENWVGGTVYTEGADPQIVDSGKYKGEKAKRILKKVFKVLGILLGIALVLFLAFQLFLSIFFKPHDVRLTNVTDTSFTVSWMTNYPMRGVVYYKEKDNILPGPLSWIGSDKAFDDRDIAVAEKGCVDSFNKKAKVSEDFVVDTSNYNCDSVKVWKFGKYFTHHVTLKNLDANKEYYFRVGDGLISWKMDMNKSATFYTLDTEVKTPAPIFGKVVSDEGDYVNDSIVYIKFVNGYLNKESMYYSSATSDNGSWYLDGNNIRTIEGEPILVEVGQDMIKAYAQYENYTLSEGYDWIYGDSTVAYPDLVVSDKWEKDLSMGSSYINDSYAAPRVTTGGDNEELKPLSIKSPKANLVEATVREMDAVKQYRQDLEKVEVAKKNTEKAKAEYMDAIANKTTTPEIRVPTNNENEGDREEQVGSTPSQSNYVDCTTTNRKDTVKCPDQALFVRKDIIGAGYAQNNLVLRLKDKNAKKDENDVPYVTGPNGEKITTELGILEAMGYCNTAVACAGNLNLLDSVSLEASAFIGEGKLFNEDGSRNKDIVNYEIVTENSGGNNVTTIKFLTESSDNKKCSSVGFVLINGQCRKVTDNWEYLGQKENPQSFTLTYTMNDLGTLPSYLKGYVTKKDLDSIKCNEKSALCTIKMDYYPVEVDSLLETLIKGGEAHKEVIKDLINLIGEMEKESFKDSSTIVLKNSIGQQVTINKSYDVEKSSGVGQNASFPVSDQLKTLFPYLVELKLENITLAQIEYYASLRQENIDKGKGLLDVKVDTTSSTKLEEKIPTEEEEFNFEKMKENLCKGSSNCLDVFLEYNCDEYTKKGSFTLKQNISFGLDSEISQEPYEDFIKYLDSTIGLEMQDLYDKYYAAKEEGDDTGRFIGRISTADGVLRTRLSVCAEKSGEAFGECMSQPLLENKVQGVSDNILGVEDQATETNTLGSGYITYLPEYGFYDMEVNGLTESEKVEGGDNNLRIFYVEMNGTPGLQFPADPDNPKVGEDYVLKSNALDIKYKKSADVMTLNLKQGVNLVSFNYIPKLDNDEYTKASSLLKWLVSKGAQVEHFSYFADGRWKGIGYVNGETTGEDFSVTPGRGYLVYSTNTMDISIPGYKITSSVPMNLSAGWNLVGVHGYTQTYYTARSLLDSINKIEGLTANNISWWPTSKGRYEGLQLSEGKEYGFDFPISPSNGYFIRINEFKPKDSNCGSLLWHEGGTHNGACGNSKSM